MPDYLVKQQITRSHAFGQSKNWAAYDRLSIAVSYRQSAGEDYKLLSVNGMPVTEDQNYNMKLGGTISTGEYVSALTELFSPESRAEFHAVDTDTLRGRRTIIYEYEVKRENLAPDAGLGRRRVDEATNHRGLSRAHLGRSRKQSRAAAGRHQHRHRTGISHHRGQ